MVDTIVCKRCGKKVEKRAGEYKKIGNVPLCSGCYDKIAYDYLRAFWRGEVS